MFFCTCFDFTCRITLALHKVHTELIFKMHYIKLNPRSFSTSFFQLSDALDFLQSYKHENEQGNKTVEKESGNLNYHTEREMTMIGNEWQEYQYFQN